MLTPESMNGEANDMSVTAISAARREPALSMEKLS